MKYENHKIVEGIAGFGFKELEDINFVYEFISYINSKGFLAKKEGKVLRINLDLKDSQTNEDIKISEQKTHTIFLNDAENKGILIDANYISFHWFNHAYKDWESFSESFVFPFLKKFTELPKGALEPNFARMHYINKLEIPKTENVSDYLKFVPSLNVVDGLGEGTETNHFFQSVFAIEPNMELIIRGNSQMSSETSVIWLENLCTAHNKNNIIADFETLVNCAHEKASAAFSKIITESFKNQIK